MRRARPVVLTALAAMLAFVPLTLSVFWGPMAVAMIGGLALATFATLLVVPALYALALPRLRRPVQLVVPRGARPSAGVAAARLDVAAPPWRKVRRRTRPPMQPTFEPGPTPTAGNGLIILGLEPGTKSAKSPALERNRRPEREWRSRCGTARPRSPRGPLRN